MILKYLKKYESYESDIKLPDIYNLKELYENNDRDIKKVTSFLNNLLENKSYLNFIKTNLNLPFLERHEPIDIVPLHKGVNFIRSRAFDVETDSIGIISKLDNSIYILSVFDDYELMIFYPKIRISDIDPYGEEDWG